MRRDGIVDRVISIASLSLTVVPEFVSGVVLIVLFAVTIKIFPVAADPPPGSGPLTKIWYLILPAIPLMFVELGYIARMARAGMIAALDTAYVRTATLKGLPRRRVIMTHALRNALAPTVAVIGTQIGWLVGGLVVVETLFNYPGIGKVMADSATTTTYASSRRRCWSSPPSTCSPTWPPTSSSRCSTPACGTGGELR